MIQFVKKNKEDEEIKTSVQPQPRAVATADTILGAIIDGVAIADAKGNIIQSNTGFAKIFGFESANEVIGHLVTETVAEREIPRVMAEFEKSFKTGRPFNQEFIGKDRSGREFPVSLNSTLLKDEKGNIVGNIGVLRDITELKKAYVDIAELKKAQEELQKSAIYLDSMSDVLSVTTMDGKIIKVNNAFFNMFGYNPEEVVGKSILEFFPKEETPKHLSEMKLAVKIGTIRSFETVALNKSGKRTPISLVGSFLRTNKEEPIALIAVFRDITEQKNAQEEIQNTVARLKASEQQQKATNQQLNATNQQLSAAQKNLRDKLSELERFNKVAVGRELKMIELKEEIARLKAK